MIKTFVQWFLSVELCMTLNKVPHSYWCHHGKDGKIIEWGKINNPILREQ